MFRKTKTSVDYNPALKPSAARRLARPTVIGVEDLERRAALVFLDDVQRAEPTVDPHPDLPTRRSE
jgi:hypothetical protein